MTGHDGSIYRICREAAGLTQEQAAEGLNCSVRSLARYESGEQHVPDDILSHFARKCKPHTVREGVTLP